MRGLWVLTGSIVEFCDPGAAVTRMEIVTHTRPYKVRGIISHHLLDPAECGVGVMVNLKIYCLIKSRQTIFHYNQSHG